MTEDRMADAHSAPADAARADLRLIIIGAGMSGILSAIKLQETGFDDFVIYEKADRLGGTWRENTYPGIACDVPSHFYSCSFALNPEWSHRFAPGAEIQAYLEDVARRDGLNSRIQCRKQISRCAFENGRWKIEMTERVEKSGVRTRDGRLHELDVLILATGFRVDRFVRPIW